MIEAKILYNSLFHKVRITDIEDNEIVSFVDLYESECDSGDDVAIIGLENGWVYTQNNIKSIEITD